MNKTRILFLTSAAPKYSPFSTSEKRFPIGIGFLASVLRSKGHEVDFIDNYLAPTGFPSGFDIEAYDVIGIYLNTICYSDGMRMIYDLQRLRERRRWNGRIAVGGPHASLKPDDIPPFVEHIVIGEGESAITEIARGAGERIMKMPYIKNLDSLPYPAYDLMRDKPYDNSARWIDRKPVISMNTSRGCPYSCAFCSVKGIWGMGYRTFSAGRVVDEMEFLKKEYGANAIYFREDNFTCNRKRVEEICRMLIARNIDLQWICETRADTCSDDLLELMKEAGCRALYVGVESGSERMLEIMRKGITVEQIRSTFASAKKYGIKTYASLITGLPDETENDRIDTQKLIDEIKPDDYCYNVYVPLPGAPLYDRCLAEGLFAKIEKSGLAYLRNHDYFIQAYNPGKFELMAPSLTRSLRITGRNIKRAMMRAASPFFRIIPQKIKKSIKNILYKRRENNV